MTSQADIPLFYAAACFVVEGGKVPPGLENRPLYLPRPYIVQSHVQCAPSGKIYVFKEDINNPARMRSIRKHVKTLQIPKGSPDRLRTDKGQFVSIPATCFLFFHFIRFIFRIFPYCCVGRLRVAVPPSVFPQLYSMFSIDHSAL